MKILIADDDPKYRAFVSRGLSEQGMDCVTAQDGESALAVLRKNPIDLVLLDVNLPGIQGWDVLEAMRRERIETPVLFVTARDAVEDRVKGLRMGGDDYIMKPFAFSELVARIHAAMRRGHVRTRRQVADLEIDYLANRVTRAAKLVDLTRIEFALLRALAERSPEPVSRTELLQQVWNLQFDPGTNIVEVHIRRLRKKIDEPFGVPLIQTIRGSGYALAEP